MLEWGRGLLWSEEDSFRGWDVWGEEEDCFRGRDVWSEDCSGGWDFSVGKFWWNAWVHNNEPSIICTTINVPCYYSWNIVSVMSWAHSLWATSQYSLSLDSVTPLSKVMLELCIFEWWIVMSRSNVPCLELCGAHLLTQIPCHCMITDDLFLYYRVHRYYSSVSNILLNLQISLTDQLQKDIHRGDPQLNKKATKSNHKI